jgi:hypothetical protein
MAVAAVAPITKTTDGFPSGSWSFGPVTVSWDLTAGNEADVTVSVLGIPVDTLKGSIKNGTVTVEDTINILGLVSGNLELDGKPDGLYISGELKGPGFDLPFNHRIIAW